MYKNILDFFEETVQRCPEKTALRHRGEAVTFAGLREKSIRLANYLAKGVCTERNRPVAVFLPKGILVTVCDVAITYSSNFFSNLDVKTPADRIGNILQCMQPAAIITNGKYLSALQSIPDLTIPVVSLDSAPWERESECPDKLFEKLVEQIDTDPFCIINTSGSTGTPKGVVLNHRSFFDFLQWSFDTFHFDGTEIIGSLSPVVFDIYDYELCLMMLKGATIVFLDAELAAFPAKLLMEMKNEMINFIFWVPTIMVNIANMGLLDKIDLSQLKTIWFAGEVFPTKQFNIWKQHLKDTVFANLYGPIEITLDCIFYIVDRDYADNEPLPIGVPCRNTDILLLNEEDQLCKVNQDGEICVRGTSLAMGYYNNPEKTALAFVQNPLNKAYPETIYRTGDVAYVNEQGLIIFKGRKDSLIKHMGYRIELGEIEHIVVNHLKLVSNCCAVYQYAHKKIVLFYEPEGGVDAGFIRQELCKVLPRYMVPETYEMLELLPRNTNGKIDRLALSKRVNDNN